VSFVCLDAYLAYTFSRYASISSGLQNKKESNCEELSWPELWSNILGSSSDICLLRELQLLDRPLYQVSIHSLDILHIGLELLHHLALFPEKF